MEPQLKTAASSKRLIDIIGWAGVGLILLAYGLVSFAVISNRQGLYQILNLIGSLGIVVSSFNKKDYEPLALNVAWALIAIFGLLSLLK